MNRQALLANASDDAQWVAISKSKKQSAVVNLAIAAMSECAANGRELDSWEASLKKEQYHLWLSNPSALYRIENAKLALGYHALKGGK